MKKKKKGYTLLRGGRVFSAIRSSFSWFATRVGAETRSVAFHGLKNIQIIGFSRLVVKQSQPSDWSRCITYSLTSASFLSLSLSLTLFLVSKARVKMTKIPWLLLPSLLFFLASSEATQSKSPPNLHCLIRKKNMHFYVCMCDHSVILKNVCMLKIWNPTEL